MSLSLELNGDWNRAGIFMKNLAVKLYPAYEAEFYSDGEMVLKKLKDHIYSQDLNWVPLSEHTIELKGGDDTIYIDTGELVNGLSVRRIKSVARGVSIFVGASPWKKHKGGMGLDELMIWLEYGTDRMPARPLIRPTFEEVKDLLQKSWEQKLKDIVNEC